MVWTPLHNLDKPAVLTTTEFASWAVLCSVDEAAEPAAVSNAKGCDMSSRMAWIILKLLCIDAAAGLPPPMAAFCKMEVVMGVLTPLPAVLTSLEADALTDFSEAVTAAAAALEVLLGLLK
jgi:hypothetical protein